MIILDTNIASTFLKINEMNLLHSLFPNHALAITTGVQKELRAANYEVQHFTTLKLTKMEMGQREILAITSGSLGMGELECIVVCSTRSIPMLTNDRKAKNVALKKGIRCYDLTEILRAFKLKGIVDLNRLKQIVQAIESKDNIIFKDVERLYGI